MDLIGRIVTGLPAAVKAIGPLGRRLLAALPAASMALILGSAGAAPTNSQTPASLSAAPPSPAAFDANYDFEVLVDGRSIPEITCYTGQALPGMLLIGAPVGGAVFTRINDRKVVGVNPTKIQIRGDRAFIPADAFGPPLSGFQTSEGIAEFSLEGKKVRVQPRPMLIGQTTCEDVIEKTPAYKHLMSLYQPDQEALSFLKQYGRPVNIEVYFGSWCHVCKQYLPQFLRTITDCANPNLHVSLFGLPKDFDKDEKLSKQKQVKGVPCIIVYKEGQEVGRIEGPPTQSYEKHLGGLLRLAASKG